ncbi:hypothetical protein CBR_g23923 [Chara braunii]|uniref:Uncharacterized protein n=1 Tax=Chara braunii TaxID=69332 RepID=A0A388L599_CHABU|nr:hypothetical protein CBR_g23923 [Chara braunii]|eukprot:GBG77475.1 hypothetical protein CBR_g23923 [Chara braunii]
MPGCGAVVFLSDDNGATWYCCGGVEKSESARNTYDGRSFRTFFLTSVFDKDGTNWVKEDKKVGLDLRLFQGYNVKAFSMKAFDVRGDGTELRMLTAERFLSRMNGYRVTDCLPVVESSLELTKLLVKFSSPADQLLGVVKEYREAFSRLPLDQQADYVFVPFVTSSRKSRQTPSALVGKRKQLATCPAPPSPAASPSPLPTVRGGHDIAQCSSEATEYDDRNLYGRNAPCDSAQKDATALTERNEEEEDGGSCGPRKDDGDNEYMDVGDENMHDQNILGDDDVGVTSEHGPGDIPTGSVGAVVGRPLSSPAIWHLQGGSQGGHDSQEHGGSKSRKRTRETSPSAFAHKRQARTDAVNEARGALVASREARPPRKSSQGGRSGSRGDGRGGARKGKQIVRAEELRDSGVESERVGPRMPDDGDEPLQHAAPIDMTRCFFLEYDERGFAKQNVLPVLVDVMKIKRIPHGNILFNHRSLSANIVRGIVMSRRHSVFTLGGMTLTFIATTFPFMRRSSATSLSRHILKFDFRKDQLTSKDYAELTKSGNGFNPVDSEEDSSDSDLELGEDTCAEVPRGGIVQAHDDGTVHSHEGSIPVTAPSVASMVAPSETAALQDNGRCGGNEEDDIAIPGEASTLAPGDAIPPGYYADPNTIYFLEGKHTHTGEDQWGHDVIWHEGVLQPCIQDGEWKMAVKYTSGWKTFRRMSKDIWLKTTELAILHRVRVKNPRQSEAAIKARAEELFHVLRDNRQLEYNNKFYALRSSPSRGSINWKVDQTAKTLEGSCSHDFMPSVEPSSVAAQAGHRGDDGTTVVGPQEVDMLSMPQISEKFISVAAAQSSPTIEVSTTLPSDAGATYGSSLITNAAMQGRSEIESESDVGPSVAESQLQPSLCTSKGDAQSPLTPQRGAGGDGGKGGDVEGMHRSRNLDTLTADID